MNPFACALDLRGAPVGHDAMTTFLPGLVAGDGPVDMVLSGSWGGAWVGSRALGRPGIARRHGIVAVGTARLANVRELAGLTREQLAPRGDLDLVIDQYLRKGPGFARDLIGDFAVIVWDPTQDIMVAARDALGVKRLYHQRRGNLLLVASHAECLNQGAYDRDVLGEFLQGRPTSPERTVYANLARLAPGTALVARGPRVTTETFWSPFEFAPSTEDLDAEDAEDAKVAFRSHFADAVRAQLDDARPTWALLSGGLDSSAVVGMAGRLGDDGRLQRGLEGSLTVVDSLSDGDETRYSSAVTERWRLPNQRVTDAWAWQPDAGGPPDLGEPGLFLPFYARDREMCRTMRAGGAEVVLSGYGSDQYLSGSWDYLADLVAARQTRRALRELVDIAVASRGSFWKLGMRHAVAPIAPNWLARRILVEPEPAPWLSRATPAALPARDPADPLGVFGRQAASEVSVANLLLERGPFEDALELRYPFLHRPLVEFALRLPASLRVRPGVQKWILRESLADVLPAAVRSRRGKGGIGGRVNWSLHHERRLLRRLIADSHLADFGLVEPGLLAAAFERVRGGDTRNVMPLMYTLALETWFAVRSGWWARNAEELSTRGTPTVWGKTPRKEQQNVVEAVVR